MKVKSLHLRGYKRFADKPLNFFDEDTGRIRNLTVLVGRNGAGKTTVLQAIASLLGKAVGKLKKPSSLIWPGYNYQLLNSSANIQAELTVSFDEVERAATYELHQRLFPDQDISQEPEIQISLNYLNDTLRFPRFPHNANQFKGRFYAIEVRKLERDSWQNFDRVGSVMWYPEHRTSTSLSGENGESSKQLSEDMLRHRLAEFYSFDQNFGGQEREGQRNVFQTLNRHFNSVFRTKTLRGPNPNIRTDIDKPPFFFLNDESDHQLYELSEMSGGERAMFPILFDFAFWKINKSVILIDELELHLHPPLQQAFLTALSSLGTDNQFIITTHSDYVASLVTEDQLIRLD